MRAPRHLGACALAVTLTAGLAACGDMEPPGALPSSATAAQAAVEPDVAYDTAYQAHPRFRVKYLMVFSESTETTTIDVDREGDRIRSTVVQPATSGRTTVIRTDRNRYTQGDGDRGWRKSFREGDHRTTNEEFAQFIRADEPAAFVREEADGLRVYRGKVGFEGTTGVKNGPVEAELKIDGEGYLRYLHVDELVGVDGDKAAVTFEWDWDGYQDFDEPSDNLLMDGGPTRA